MCKELERTCTVIVLPIKPLGLVLTSASASISTSRQKALIISILLRLRTSVYAYAYALVRTSLLFCGVLVAVNCRRGLLKVPIFWLAM